MQEEEIKELVARIGRKKTEEQTVELKAAHQGFPHKIYDTLSSFSNQDEGGIIVFGVDENADYQPVGVYDANDVQRKIMEACDQMSPKVRALITVGEVDEKKIVTAEIPGVAFASRPVYYRGAGRLKGSYVRVGDADEPMSEYEVYSYEAFRKRIKDDLRPVEAAKVSLFQKEVLDRYLEAVKKERVNIAENCTDEQILELMGITADGISTLAGVMTFSLYPQAYFPQLCITAVVVPGTKISDTAEDGARFIDNERITGSIGEMADAAVAFVQRNMRTKTIINQDGRRQDKDEYPIKAVREAILNMLIHRDYSIYTENIPSSIEMYRDRIVFRNCGGLFGAASVELLGRIRPETRNAALANMLELLKITENRYSGIPTIYKELEKAGLPEPVFDVRHGEFTVTFYNDIYQAVEEIDKSDLNKAILQYCQKPRTREEIISFTHMSRYYTMKKYIFPLVQSGQLALTLPDKPKSRNQKYYTVR